MNRTEKKTGLTKGLKYFYGIGDMGFALMTSVASYYHTFYLTNVAHLNLATVGILMSICSIFDTATSWVYGAVINSVKPMKWGRYRSWLMATTWIMPFTSFFLYFRVGRSDTVAVAVFFVFMIASRIVQNFAYTANVAMINIVGKTADDRVALSSSRATYNNASKFAWSYLGVPFLAILANLLGEEYSYAALASILSVGTLVGYFIHFKLTEGYEDSGSEELANAAKAKRAKTNVVDLLKALFANPPLLALVIADLAKWLFNFLVAGMVVYYFTYIAFDKGLQATYTLIIAFMAVFGAYGSRFIGQKLSGRTAMIVLYLVMAACLVAARVIYTNVWGVIVLVSAAQLCYGCVYSCSSALYGDTAVYSEWKTGKNASGWIMGLMNLPLKIASTLKFMIITAALAAGGFSAEIAPEAASESVRVGIANALLIIPAALLILGAFVLIFLYRLPKSKVEQMQKEIDERKAAEEADA